MKTNRTMSVIVALVALFSASAAKAQCPSLKNDLNCTIVVNMYEYTAAMVLCSGPTPISVPANTTIGLTCGTCPIVEIELVQANGLPVTPISAITSPATGFPGPSTSTSSACGTGNANIYFDNGPNNQFEVNR